MDERQEQRELSNRIMEKLAEGGLNGNMIGLTGKISQIQEIDNICGFPFAGYSASVAAMRVSGSFDYVPVYYPLRIAEDDFVDGESVLVQGKVLTMKNFETGKMQVFVLAEFIASALYPLRQDDVALRGRIAYDPVLRETPNGKMVTDVFLRVDNEITGGKSCIPCICWNKKAREAREWKQGDVVILSGRFQSRIYEKVVELEPKKWEKRVALEISCHTIARIEEDAECVDFAEEANVR